MKFIVIRAIYVYQYLFRWRISPCRYIPSCSQYAIEAVEVHGVIKGLAYSVIRIARCNPWGGHGLDLVPQPRGDLMEPQGRLNRGTN